MLAEKKYQEGETQGGSLPVIIRWSEVPSNFPLEKLLPFLAREEKIRIESFKFEPDRQICCAAHILLRMTIQKAFKVRSYELRYETGGKPYAVLPDGTHAHVSLSHSKGLAAIGLSLGCRIGVDIESYNRNMALEELLPLVLSNHEQAEWATVIKNEQPADVFLRRWTLKEAIVKATGQGILADFTTFSVALAPPKLIEGAPDATAAEDWQLHVTPVDGGYLSMAAHDATHKGIIFDIKRCMPQEYAAHSF